jgi:ABC-type transporter lipoprotein component MlaA
MGQMRNNSKIFKTMEIKQEQHFAFVYVKGKERLVLTHLQALDNHAQLLDEGHNHTNTIDPYIALKYIADTINGYGSSQEKIENLKQLFNNNL